MLRTGLAPPFAAIFSLIATVPAAAQGPWIATEATRSRITVVDVNGSSPRVVLDTPRRYAAPEWTPDGRDLIVNGGGRLWRLPIAGGAPSPIAIDQPGWIDINHAVSPDGRTLAFTSGSIWLVPIRGGRPTRVADANGSWVHGWSPDGRRLAFSADRGQGLDVYTIAKDGRSESRLTADSHRDDVPQFSADGRWIYFLSDAPAPATSGGCRPTAPGRETRRPSRSRPTTARTRHPAPRPTASGWSTSRTRPARPSTPWTATS